MIKDILNILIDKKEFFADLLLQHIEISVIAIVIAIVVGGLTGILISEYEKTAKPTLGVINFLYTIPSISMLGFLIPFSGVGNITAVIALTIYALLPMVRNTHTGIKNVNTSIIEAAEGMGSTRLQILYKIKIPLAMPVIMSGIRSMITMTIALAGIASFIGAGGLGVAIYRGITTNNTAMTMAGSLLIAILALVMDFIIGLIERKIKVRLTKEKKKKYIVAIAAVVICICMIVVSVFTSNKLNTIQIATKPMTEQYILGNMLKMIIEKETNLKAEVTQGVGGGTSNIQPAMEKGDFDIYPEYTGTAWNMVLKREGLYTEELFNQMENEYEEKYNMKWIGMYGFNNTYGLVVRKEIADKYDLKTYSDLQAVAKELTFGAEYDFFEREDGYDALCKEYGLNFNKTMDLDIGLKYQAINQGKIDVMNIFTTDGQLTDSEVVVLKDDKSFYPSYLCGNVVRNEVLEAHPELKEVLNKFNGILTDSKMAELNYKVESLEEDPEKVAKEFLKEVGLL